MDITVKNTPALIKDSTEMDYDKQTIVGKFRSSHYWAVPESEYFPYVLRKPASTLKVIFEDIFNIIKWNDQLYVENMERNVLLKIFKKEKLEVHILSFDMFESELEGIKFLKNPTAGIRGYFGDILKQESKFDFNSIFIACKERNERMFEWDKINKCTNSEAESNSQVKQGYKITYLGEIAKFEKCAKIQIPINLGTDYGCAKGHLVTKYDEKIVGIKEYSRIMVSQGELKMINCSQGPIFLKITHNHFIGNRGDGLQIIQINEKQSEHLGQKIYVSSESTFLADFNNPIQTQGHEDLSRFDGQASNLEMVEHKLSFFEKITGPMFSVEHLFTDVLPLFVKLFVLTLVLIVMVVVFGLISCGCWKFGKKSLNWCTKKQFTTEEFEMRTK